MLEDIEGMMVVGTIDQLLCKPFIFLFDGERKKGDLRKAIDASNSARLGKSLISFANFAGPGTYYYHGGGILTSGHTLANVEIVFSSTLDRISVKTIKNISPGEELLFPVGEHKDFIPTTIQQAMNLNIVHRELPIYQPYRPIDMERLFGRQLLPIDVDRAIKFLAFLKFKYDGNQTQEVLFTRYNIDFTVEDMLRY